MLSAEFQAVVFAGGRGTRLPELIGDRPKCLLPVGPFPMVWYPLHLLQNHGFQEAILIVLESQKSEIQQALEKTPLKMRIDYATIPSDSDFGTAEALRHVKDKIKLDILVVPCDVITNGSLEPLLNTYRLYDAALVAFLFEGGAEMDVVIPGPKTKHKAERDLIGLHPMTSRLCFIASANDFEEVMDLSGHLLRRNEKLTMHSRLVDSHIYVIRKWVVDFLAESQEFSTIKGELLPFIIKKQMSRSTNATDSEKPMSEFNVNTKVKDVFDYITRTVLDRKIEDASFFNDSLTKSPFNSDSIRCYAELAPREITGIRVNTIAGYCAANQKIFDMWDGLVNDASINLISAGCTNNCTQMGKCAIADKTVVADKTSLKSTSIGHNCTINTKVRITASILMNNVTIEEGVILENCIICSRAIVKSGSVLKNCLVGPNFVVAEKTLKEKAHLTNADDFMEIE